MFSIVDRYVARSFLYSFAVFFFVFVGLFIVVDTFSNIEDFLAAGFWQLPGTLLKVYMVRIFTIFQQTAPLVTVTSGMFTVSRMNKNNELIPVKASGMSVYRVLWPVFLLALAATGVFVANQEFVIPALGDRLIRYDKMLRGKELGIRFQLIIKDSRGSSFRVSAYRVFEKTMSHVNVTEYFAPGREKTDISAETGIWKRDVTGQFKWHLSSGSINRFDEAGESLPGYPRHFFEDGVVVDRDADKFLNHLREEEKSSPQEIPPRRLGEGVPGRVDYFLSDLVPEALEKEELSFFYLSTASLKRQIRSFAPPVPPELEVEFHRRYSLPMANLVLLVLGLPFVLRRESRGLLFGVGFCIVLCGAYLFVESACVELGRKEIVSPVAAAWFPVLLFGPVGVLLFDGVPT